VIVLIILSNLLYAGANEKYIELFKSGDQEPWVFRGGVLGEFQVCILGMPGLLNVTFLFSVILGYECINISINNLAFLYQRSGLLI